MMIFVVVEEGRKGEPMSENIREYIYQTAKDCDGIYCHIKKGEIIRCKDCKHYHTDVSGSELGIGGMYENIIVAHNACDRWAKGMNCVEPEGFCFLAERNE